MAKDNEQNKKKKIKISFTKLIAWLALLTMVGSAFVAILSPLFYGN